MSTRQSTQGAFIQGNQNNIDHDASESALIYLFQEVSKLATPIHNSLLDIKSVTVEQEIEDAPLFHTSNIPSEHSLSYVSQCNHKKTVKEESQSSKVTSLTDAHPEHNSPWKVLSLINLQCDRLLHHSAVGSDQSTASSTTILDYSVNDAVTAPADVTDEGVGGDCLSIKTNLRPSLPLCDGQVPDSVSLVGDVQEVSSGEASFIKPQCLVKDSKVSCNQSQSAVKETLGLKLVMENEVVSPDSQHKDSEDDLSVSKQPEQKQERDIWFNSEQILDVSFSGNVLSQKHNSSNFPNNTQLTFNFNEDVSAALSKPGLTLDHNANYDSTTEPLSDSQLAPPSQSETFYFSSTEDGLSKQDDKLTDCKPLEKSTPVSPLSSLINNDNSNLSQKQEPGPSTQESPSSVQQWRTKTLRKQPCPCRSADIQDPDFQGVTFRMDTEMDNNTNQCRLLITSKFSKELCKGGRKPKLRTRTSQMSLKTSSSEEESDSTTCVSKGKVCASCCTRKTPMWRDAEDGTPLCNACGIRYKKYRVRCVNCWHIPRKEGNSNSRCIKCGNAVRPTPTQRKHST